MDFTKNVARTVGILFLVGTIAGILSAFLTGNILTAPDYLSQISKNENNLRIGALLVLIMGFSLTMIPVMLFPIFKRINASLALGAVVFRGALEAVAYLGIVTAWFLLITLSREFANSGSVNTSIFQVLGNVLLRSVDWTNYILAMVFSLGALMIYFLFYQSKLIPKWLSIWGLVGAVLYLITPLLGIFGVKFDFLMAPLGLQEMVLAVWLIVKGFDQAANLEKLKPTTF